MGIAVTDPEDTIKTTKRCVEFEPLVLKAEALLRRQRERREEEVRREQRKADAAIVRAAGCQKLRRCEHEAVYQAESQKLIGMREIHDPACPVAMAALLEGK